MSKMTFEQFRDSEGFPLTSTQEPLWRKCWNAAHAAGSGDAIGQQMEIVELQEQLNCARNVVSRSINYLEQVKLALEEDDTAEAMRIILEATGDEG